MENNIKFRYRFKKSYEDEIYTNIILMQDFETKSDTFWFFVNNVIISRDLWTWLKDRTWKEIFEGDIIYDWDNISIIRYWNIWIDDNEWASYNKVMWFFKEYLPIFSSNLDRYNLNNYMEYVKLKRYENELEIESRHMDNIKESEIIGNIYW